jgi:hypothetical protein
MEKRATKKKRQRGEIHAKMSRGNEEEEKRQRERS